MLFVLFLPALRFVVYLLLAGRPPRCLVDFLANAKAKAGHVVPYVDLAKKAKPHWLSSLTDDGVCLLGSCSVAVSSSARPA